MSRIIGTEALDLGHEGNEMNHLEKYILPQRESIEKIRNDGLMEFLKPYSSQLFVEGRRPIGCVDERVEESVEPLAGSGVCLDPQQQEEAAMWYASVVSEVTAHDGCGAEKLSGLTAAEILIKGNSFAERMGTSYGRKAKMIADLHEHIALSILFTPKGFDRTVFGETLRTFQVSELSPMATDELIVCANIALGDHGLGKYGMFSKENPIEIGLIGKGRDWQEQAESLRNHSGFGKIAEFVNITGFNY